MARHKFASNVCEKALTYADSENRYLLIEELMAPRPDGLSPIVALMRDQYASKSHIVFSRKQGIRMRLFFTDYVLQRALMLAEGEQREILISKVQPQLTTMRRYSSAYNKHLSSSKQVFFRSVALFSHSYYASSRAPNRKDEH